MFVGLSIETLGVSLVLEQVNNQAKRFPVGLGVGANYVWPLVIIVIFMGLGEAKRWGWHKVLKSSYGGQATKGEDFHGGVDLSRHHTLVRFFEAMQSYVKKDWT